MNNLYLCHMAVPKTLKSVYQLSRPKNVYQVQSVSCIWDIFVVEEGPLYNSVAQRSQMSKQLSSGQWRKCVPKIHWCMLKLSKLEPWRDIRKGKFLRCQHVASRISSLEGKCDQANLISQDNWPTLQLADF